MGESVYEGLEAPATPEQKAALEKLSAEQVTIKELAGEEIHAILTDVPDSSAPVGRSKVMPESGWFTARQSGTQDVYKPYAETFQGLDRLHGIQEEAQRIVSDSLRSSPK